MACARAVPGPEVSGAASRRAYAVTPQADKPQSYQRPIPGPPGADYGALVKNWIALVACALASCAYVEATRVNYVGVPRYAPVKPEQVQVLPNEPKQRHERLGEIVLDISVDPPAPVGDIEARLREEGAQMGANAVYVIRDVARPGEARKLVGIAVRYQP